MVHPDIAYLADTGAVARYDVANGVDESLLARLATQMAAPAWDTPLDNRGLTQYMPTTGGRFDIGPATGWQAAWLISGDARASWGPPPPPGTPPAGAPNASHPAAYR